ncbi:MAG: gamma-glutamylcyclotransferase [Leptolyngbyaceae bacterium]|nr:gamma-glutamylcyclotransferase [Leptolyngbyaceae bacterium]
MTHLIQVFVYGTLKPGESNYRRYCLGKVVEEYPAIALGQLYALPQGYPAMTPGDNPVYGYLLAFADPGILVSLDQLEGYHPSQPREQNDYDRQSIPIFGLNQELLGTAWGYLMTPKQVEQQRGILLPGGRWSGQA